LYTGLKVNRFFGLVAVPNEHVLRKPQISPEYGESEHEFAKIMQMFFISKFQVALVF
jgi:hypothetical protein